MCSHSSSGNAITEKISQKLYPFIAMLFQEVVELNESQPMPAEFNWDIFYTLKSEFESLKNYELKLVFPSVLKVFNTKDVEGEKPAINITELQMLTRNKEILMADLVADLALELHRYSVEDMHPLRQLQFVLQTSFVQEKQQWHQMLKGWSTGCACFMAAQSNAEQQHNHNNQ